MERRTDGQTDRWRGFDYWLYIGIKLARVMADSCYMDRGHGSNGRIPIMCFLLLLASMLFTPSER